MNDDNINQGESKFKKVTSALGKSTKNAISKIKEKNAEITIDLAKKKESDDLKRLAPVFYEDIISSDFEMPKMIQIVNYDKRLENKVCEGSVGFLTKSKSAKVLTIYSQYLHLIDMQFYPQKGEGVYYVNPCIKDLYISLDEFFSYMKQVRVNELTNVAHMLGAQSFKVVLNVFNESKSGSKTSSNIGKFGIKGSYATDSYEKSEVTVAADIQFTGSSSPKMPTLLYFKDDSDIKSLIEMRLNPDSTNQIKSKTYSISYGKSTGISIDQTFDISTVLKEINCGISEKFTKSIVRECNTILEYSIVF